MNLLVCNNMKLDMFIYLLMSNFFILFGFSGIGSISLWIKKEE